MRFLGTSAGEGIPTPFCECDICRNAREKGGPEKRLRSSFRLSERTAIDLGADFVAAAANLGESLFPLEHVLFTHTHEDHFNYHLIWTRFVARRKLDRPLNIYFTDQAYSVLEKFYFTSPTTAGREHYTKPEDVLFHRLEFCREHQIDDMTVVPLRGNHSTNIEPNSANYLFRLADGRTLYYGLDTGYYLEETFEYLRNVKIDLLISECTMPAEGKDRSGQHMNLTTCVAVFDRLLDQGTISPQTGIYLTHIAPVGATHAQLCACLETLDRPYRPIAAFDGLRLD